MNEIGPIIIWIVIGIIIWYLIHKTITFGNLDRRIKDERRHAIKQSKAVNLWHISEQIAPLLPEFPYHIKDMVFIGKWFDYLVLDWLSDGDLRKIVFVEIKTGRSSQNRNERMIQSIIHSKQVSYELIKI